MRMYAAALPALAVAWVEVMIRHFELTHGIWRLQRPDAEPVDVHQLKHQLTGAIRRLSRQTLQLLPNA